MKIIINLIITIVVAFGLSNCYSGQYGNPAQTMFINKGVNGFSGTSFNGKDRTGEACITSIFALFAIGDGSIQKAARMADITKISSISHDTKQNMFFTQDICTVVRGQ